MSNRSPAARPRNPHPIKLHRRAGRLHITPAQSGGALLAVGIMLAAGWWLRDVSSVGPPRDAGNRTQPSTMVPSEPAIDLASIRTTRQALDLNLQLLEAARVRLLAHRDHAARFVRRERVGGMLRSPEVIELIVRHEPYAARMTWPEGGRDVIYLAGQNDGKMLVRLGGLGRVFGYMKIALDDKRATSESRYPITEAGLLKFVDRLLGYRRRDLELTSDYSCQVDETPSPDGRACYRFTFLYGDPQVEPVYRKSLVWFDQAQRLPVATLNYTWPDDDRPRTEAQLDEETLIENYNFRDLRFDLGLKDEHFAGPQPATKSN